MKRRFLWWVYRWIDRRGRIPPIARWLWPSSHWCPEMDSLLILWNSEDCFCDHVEQPKAFCRDCREIVERRWMNDEHECFGCAPPYEGNPF